MSSCSILRFVIILACTGAYGAAFAETRYYRLCPEPGNSACGSPDDFVVALENADQIRTAADILAGKITDRVHVKGRLVAQPAPYNAPWNFYIDPKTIEILTFGNTTCRGYTTTEVNARLNQLGSPEFLPTGYWCPVGYKISQEVQF